MAYVEETDIEQDVINSIEEMRTDGYSNMLTKWGTKRDSSTQYQYNPEPLVSDMELARLYEENGLFSKIIDRPSEEAVKHGLDIDFGHEEINEYVDTKLDAMQVDDAFATAEKWARLYGGSLIVMLVDDGRGLEEPLDWENVRSIDELRVYDRTQVNVDTASLYNYHYYKNPQSLKPLGEPEFYDIYSVYGNFRVHSTRCLKFRNGKAPEHTATEEYRLWGIPEYLKIKKALRECEVAHEDGVKLMERSVQAIYKMKNLANMLSTAQGEDKVIQRLQLIDASRSIISSIAIDNDGEDYGFQTFSYTGVQEIVDSTCNMLSAVTNIPQTVLFGRSPAGENATGENDLENYYNLIETIQKQNMKANARTIIDLILLEGYKSGSIQTIPKYKVKFASIWSTSEADEVSILVQRAGVQSAEAQTYILYMQSGILTQEEVRRLVANDEAFEISPELPEELKQQAQQAQQGMGNPLDELTGQIGEEPLTDMEETQMGEVDNNSIVEGLKTLSNIAKGKSGNTADVVLALKQLAEKLKTPSGEDSVVNALKRLSALTGEKFKAEDSIDEENQRILAMLKRVAKMSSEEENGVNNESLTNSLKKLANLASKQQTESNNSSNETLNNLFRLSKVINEEKQTTKEKH